jgi:hypothetical protein
LPTKLSRNSETHVERLPAALSSVIDARSVGFTTLFFCIDCFLNTNPNPEYWDSIGLTLELHTVNWHYNVSSLSCEQHQSSFIEHSKKCKQCLSSINYGDPVG